MCRPPTARCGSGATPRRIAGWRPGRATLPAGTLGYEWDADPDNGFRPAGRFRLSSTTVTGAQILLDYGSTFGPGTVDTPPDALPRAERRAASSAPAPSSGPGGSTRTTTAAATPRTCRMQQATVNLFADMGVQPGSLAGRPGRGRASPPTPPPRSSVTSPAEPARDVTAGSRSRCTGTAADAGGGLVAGVEVSVDGGATWHPADGRETWAYTFRPSATGTV